MLMRTDPFRELDRLTQQVFGTRPGRPFMPMDAWREGDVFVVEFDLPGVERRLDRPRRRAQRADGPRRAAPAGQATGAELIAAERPRGVFSRQLILGDNLDLDHVQASYADGVLSLRIPVAERAKPRKITVESGKSDQQAITVEGQAS